MFYDPSEFDFVKNFQDNIDIIRTELLNLDSRILDIHRAGAHEDYLAMILNDNGWMPCWNVGQIEPNHNWLTYALSYKGIFPKEASEKFPVTMKILSQLKGCYVCAVSNMMPFSFIAPHVHNELGGSLLTFHLGIEVTPKTSFLCVNGEFNEEKNNKAIIFDGSAEHFAINMSSSQRVILYMEFDRFQM